MTKQQPGIPDRRRVITRRQFGAGAAGLSLALTGAAAHARTGANATIRLGLIGCGGRGQWIAKLFREHGGYQVAAAADYFPDRLRVVGAEFKIPEARLYDGLAGYKRLLESDGIDAVAIESPPYFHPEQAEAAVDAGKHVYVAKPIAVDVPGCKTIGHSGELATEKKLCFLVDFQTRADPFYQEALRRVHDGALGQFAFGESTYHAGIPWKGQIPILQEDPKNPANRLRAWGLDRVLSGDIITEQNIHTLDVANWIMGKPPISAYGTGARKVREMGTCWDTFSVVFQYADNVGVTFSSRQFNGHGSQPEGIRNRMFGSRGVLETKYGGQVIIRGEEFYRGGASPGIFKDGAVANIATFHDSIQSSDWSNPTVADSVRSNLLTILGRTAAYEGRVVTWEEVVNSDEQLAADLKGLKS